LGGREGVGEVAVCGVQDEGGVLGGGVGRDEPTRELGDAGIVDAEVDLGEREVERAGCGGDGARGVEDELPLAPREEDADGGVGAEEGDDEDGGEGFEYPSGFYERDHLGRFRATLRIVTRCEAGGLEGLVGANAGILGHGSDATSRCWFRIS